MAVSGDQQVLAALERWRREMQARAEAAMAEVMAALEGWAKAEHAYTDRTGNNTNSIRGEVTDVSAALVRGVLSAGMSYSVFLELARDGKWAFLMPVIQRHQHDIMTIIKRRMEG